MILCWDTETSTLVQRGLAHDHPRQARLVELGAVLADDDGTERASLSLIVRPDGWTIHPAAASVHGVTNELAERSGIEAVHALTAFACLLERADLALAYNLPYDRDVVSIELLYLGEPRPVAWPDHVTMADVMELVAPIVNLPPTPRMLRFGINKPKSPKLSEAYRHFFNEELDGAHSALVDARATLRVWLRATGRG